MTAKITSLEGISFLTSPTLIAAIREIEARLPGWWWSLSQMTDKVTLSTGPGRNTPNAKDLTFSKTRQGDTGFIQFTNHASHTQESSFLEWLRKALINCEAHRQFTIAKDDDITHCNTEPFYRHQSAMELDRLVISYDSFLDKVSVIENNKRTLDELYLGSCDLSADCSLRGRRADGSRFDVSVDLTGIESSLSESMDWVVVELYGDILTPGSSDYVQTMR